MQVYANTFFAMNTRFVLVLPGIDENKGEQLCDKITALVDVWEQRLSRYIPESDVSYINREAYKATVSVPVYMADVIDQCNAYYFMTNGLFDPGFSSVYDLLKENETMDRNALPQKAKLCGWANIEWNKTQHTIRFLSSEVKLDFGAIGKGIALKKVMQLLNETGIRDAFLSFGESSIAGMGKHPAGNEWLVATAPGAKKTALNNECLSVSGLHQKNECTQAHIFNPHKNELLTNNALCVVKSVCPVKAEVLSTAALLADEDGLKQLKLLFPEEQIQRIKLHDNIK